MRPSARSAPSARPAGRRRRPRAPRATLRFERDLWTTGRSRVVGVDEVGVACLAGPVVAAAVLMPEGGPFIRGVKDSKILSRPERERLDREIRRRAIAIGVGAASVAEIDRLNIYHATHLAMRRALRRVGAYDHVLIDGRTIYGFDVGPHTEIVNGDAKCFAIACASIVAKVLRDRLMERLARRHPQYGWEHNCGYPTIDHRAALRAHGFTPLHRRDFGTVRLLRLGEQLTLIAGLQPT